MDDELRVTQRAHLQMIADRIAAAGVCSAPLYAAVAAGQIAVVQIRDHRSAWPAAAVAAPKRPVVVLVSGDPGWGEPTFGPLQWKCAERLRRWAASAMVHGAAGQPEHYQLAAVTAVLVGRFALIETTSALARSWQAFLSPMPTMGFLPENGAEHPVAPDRSSIQ